MPDSNEIVLSLDIPSSEVIGSAENSEGTLESLSGTFREVGDQKLTEATSKFLEMVSEDNSLMVRLDTQSGEALFTGMVNAPEFAERMGEIISNNVRDGIDQSSSISRIIELLESGSRPSDGSSGEKGSRSRGNARETNTSNADEEDRGIVGQMEDEAEGLSVAANRLESLLGKEYSGRIKSLREESDRLSKEATRQALFDEAEEQALILTRNEFGDLPEDRTEWSEDAWSLFSSTRHKYLAATRRKKLEDDERAKEQAAVDAANAASAAEQSRIDKAVNDLSTTLSDIGIDTSKGNLGNINDIIGTATGGKGSLESLLGGALGEGTLSRVVGLLGKAVIPVGVVGGAFKAFSDMRDQFNQMADRGEQSGLEGIDAYGAAASQDMNSWIQTTLMGRKQGVVNDANKSAMDMGYQIGSAESNQVSNTLATLVSDKGISNPKATGLYKILVEAGSFNNQQLIEKVDELQNVIGQFGGMNMEQAAQAYMDSSTQLAGIGYTSSGASDIAMEMSSGWSEAVGGTAFAGDTATVQSFVGAGGISRYHAAALNPQIYAIAEKLVQNGVKAIQALGFATVHYAVDMAFADRGGADFITDILSGSNGMNRLLSVLGIAMGSDEDSSVEEEMATLEGLRSAESVAGSQEYRTYCGFMSSILGMSIDSPEVAAKQIATAWEVIYGITIQGAKGISYSPSAEGSYMDASSIDLWSGSGYTAEGSLNAGIQAAAATGQSVVPSPNYASGGSWQGSNNVTSTVVVSVHDNTTDYHNSYAYHADSTRDANSTVMVGN